MPDAEAIRQYIHENPGPLNKREIARAFGIKGQDRTLLRKMLRELSEAGHLEKTAGKSYAAPDTLPERALIEITGLDADGELLARPIQWLGKGPEPVIYVLDKRRSGGVVEPGDQVLARLKKTDDNEYEARILKTLEDAGAPQVVGVFKHYKGGGYVYPTDKRNKEDYFIPPEFMNGAEDGDLVLAEPLPHSSKYPKSKNASRIAERLGKKDDPRLISLIAIHSQGIPTVFPKEALKEAEAMSEPDLSGGRTDLRHIPLVTIDGADARDFDDAVFAEPDAHPKNPGGWHIVVAIADVSFYVRQGMALDKSAFERGNSTYFADRVVPMLPERLSNDLCSLRPRVNRACLAVHMWIDKDARLTGYKFVRGLMRSEARLTYEQVEDAHLGYPDETTGPLIENVIKPLYAAYAKLKHAREKRGALELDLPERKAVINDKGHVTAIVPRVRLQSHQLIEEFMILANVAAAMALEDRHAPCLYRGHAPPSYDRLEATREFLKELGYSLPKTDQIEPRNINHILSLSAKKDDKDLVHTMLLRTQSAAVYTPDNIGHFGLALEKYAHFTSPIRRYADLVVHRSLVRAYNLGPGGLTEEEEGQMEETAEHICVTERRSMLAERDVMDRFTAQYLSDNVGKIFKGKIASVTHFGMFVALDETGADGIVPMRSLPRDFYIHDEKRHTLTGKDSGRTFRLADPVMVRLVEADPMRGSTVFEIVSGDGDSGGGAPRSRHARGRGGRKGGGRHGDGHGQDRPRGKSRGKGKPGDGRKKTGKKRRR
ncbi:MAG: ribonuclease R [Alphaproteobacteria bacterium]|nr:ribonuclease R [Alphaproteobacteria bacterium]